MAGNRAIFERALEDSRTAIERGDWVEALRAATRAAQEFPSDLDARGAMAVALYHAHKYQEAVGLLEDLRRRRGADHVTLSYLARAYQGAEMPAEAVAALLELSELSLREGRTADAQEALEEAIRLAPGDEQLRVRLAELFVDCGQPLRAAEQCVEIARARYVAGDWLGTQEAIDEALGLDPDNETARRLQAEVRHAREPRETRTATTTFAAMQSGNLSDPQLQIDQLVTRANQERASGQNTAALNSYREALMLGANRADILYGYGILLQEQGKHDEAVEVLRRASASDEYAISAQYALGESLRAIGQIRAAAEAYEQTLRLVDLNGVGRAEADDLIAMYQAAAECYVELGELSRAASLYGTLAAFFQSKRWGRELAEQFKGRASELTERSMVARLRRMGTGALPVERGASLETSPEPETEVWGSMPSLTDFLQPEVATTPSLLSVEQSIDPFSALSLPEVAEATFAPLTPLPVGGVDDLTARYITASSRFTEQGFWHSAIDACHEVIRIAPDYLPIHLRLGEIYEREGRVEQALVKYRTLIDSYGARQQPLEAIDAFYRLIELSPDTINTRSQLAELLRQAGRLDEAVDQALMVASTLFKVGQSNRALEEFRRLLTWAPPSPVIYKEYGQALLKLERWEAALEEFRRAAQLDPRDPVAMAQVNLTVAILGTNERALWESLSALLEQLRADARSATAVQSEYRTALMIVDTPILHYILGIIQQACNQHGVAILSFQQALTTRDDGAAAPFSKALAHQALAESYLAQGQASEAVTELEAVLSIIDPAAEVPADAPSFAYPLPEPELQRRLAAALVTVDNPDAAVKALRRAISLDPYDIAAYTQLAAVYFLQGKLPLALEQLDRVATAYEQRQQLDAAIETLEQAAKLAPNTISVRARLANLLIRRGRLERGLRELNEVAQLQKIEGRTREAVASMQQAAEAYWMLGQQAEAFRLHAAIVALVPDDIELREQLVNLHVLAGQYDRAVAELHRIAERSLQAGNDSDAIASLHQIVSLDPNDTDAHLQLSRVLMQRGEHDQALRFLKRLQRLHPANVQAAALLLDAQRHLAAQQAGIAEIKADLEPFNIVEDDGVAAPIA